MEKGFNAAYTLLHENMMVLLIVKTDRLLPWLPSLLVALAHGRGYRAWVAGCELF